MIITRRKSVWLKLSITPIYIAIILWIKFYLMLNEIFQPQLSLAKAKRCPLIGQWNAVFKFVQVCITKRLSKFQSTQLGPSSFHAQSTVNPSSSLVMDDGRAAVAWPLAGQHPNRKETGLRSLCPRYRGLKQLKNIQCMVEWLIYMMFVIKWWM